MALPGPPGRQCRTSEAVEESRRNGGWLALKAGIRVEANPPAKSRLLPPKLPFVWGADHPQGNKTSKAHGKWMKVCELNHR